MKKILTVLIVMVLAAGLLIGGCSGGSPETATTQEYAKVGEIAPNFQLKNLAGDTVSLESFRGKEVLINFWATYCGPCMDEMPLLQQVHSERAGDLVILAINAGEEDAKARDFIERTGYTFPVLLDTKTEVAMKYGIQYLPTTFIIDKDGTILKMKIGAFPNKSDLDLVLF